MRHAPAGQPHSSRQEPPVPAVSDRTYHGTHPLTHTGLARTQNTAGPAAGADSGDQRCWVGGVPRFSLPMPDWGMYGGHMRVGSAADYRWVPTREGSHGTGGQHWKTSSQGSLRSLGSSSGSLGSRRHGGAALRPLPRPPPPTKFLPTPPGTARVRRKRALPRCPEEATASSARRALARMGLSPRSHGSFLPVALSEVPRGLAARQAELRTRRVYEPRRRSRAVLSESQEREIEEAFGAPGVAGEGEEGRGIDAKGLRRAMHRLGFAPPAR
jgi:hypothetical protein